MYIVDRKKELIINAAGKNTTLWPGFTVEFAARTARMRAGDYIMRKRGELLAVVPSSKSSANAKERAA